MIKAPPGTPDESDAVIRDLKRQIAELRAEYLNASKDAMELAGKLDAAEAENARLRALPLKDEALRAELSQAASTRQLMNAAMTELLDRAETAETRVTALEAALLAIRETYCHSRGTRLPVIAQIDDVVSAALGGSDHG